MKLKTEFVQLVLLVFSIVSFYRFSISFMMFS